MTSCCGALRLATYTFGVVGSIFAAPLPSTAAIPPFDDVFISTSSLTMFSAPPVDIAIARCHTSSAASSLLMHPPATSAASSPKLWPATKSGLNPASVKIEYTPSSHPSVVGCAFNVLFIIVLSFSGSWSYSFLGYKTDEAFLPQAFTPAMSTIVTCVRN